MTKSYQSVKNGKTTRFSGAGTFSASTLTAAIMACGVAASAQQYPKADTNAPTQLPEVKVKGQQGSSYKPEAPALPKLTQPLRDTPQSISVVPRQVMDDQGATTLRDALRNVAGISIAAGEGGSQGDSLTIRGFAARTDLFLDGMRDFGSYYRDSFDFEQVDALKGPASVMFGRGSTGGTINQESKVPFMKPTVEGTVAFGTDMTRRATMDINEPVKELGQGAAFRLNLIGQESGVAGRDKANIERWGVAPSLVLGLGTPTRYYFNYFNLTENDVPDYGIPWYFDRPANVPRRNYYGFARDNYLKTDVDIITMKIEHDVNDSVMVRDQVRYANYDRNVLITEPKLAAGVTPATPLNAVGVVRNELSAVSTEGFLQNQADVTAKFGTGPVDHELVGGIEAATESSDPTRRTYTGVTQTSLLHPNANDPFMGQATVSSRVQASIDSVALYVLDTMKLNEQWDLMGGVRWDHAETESRQFIAPQGDFHRTDDMPSWRGAVVFKPKKNGSFYFGYGTSFNPSAEQISLSAGNQNLPPESNETFELGTKWDLLDNRLSLRAALFRTIKSNARETNPTNSLLIVESGTQRSQGFELEAGGAITEEWRVIATYAYVDSAVLNSRFFPASVGAPLANAPQNTFSIWTTYEFPFKMEFGIGADYVSSRAGSTTIPYDPTTHQLKSVPGYIVGNAMLKYTFNKHVNLQLNVYNLGDNYYIDQVHPAHLVPGAGRTAMLTMNYKF